MSDRRREGNGSKIGKKALGFWVIVLIIIIGMDEEDFE